MKEMLAEAPPGEALADPEAIMQHARTSMWGRTAGISDDFRRRMLPLGRDAPGLVSLGSESCPEVKVLSALIL